MLSIDSCLFDNDTTIEIDDFKSTAANQSDESIKQNFELLKGKIDSF